MKMIEPSLLTREEMDYLNTYHEQCREHVGPLLREMGLIEGVSWLVKETEPLG
jgi:Xaa-Pro aminopeptidase